MQIIKFIDTLFSKKFIVFQRNDVNSQIEKKIHLILIFEL